MADVRQLDGYRGGKTKDKTNLNPPKGMGRLNKRDCIAFLVYLLWYFDDELGNINLDYCWERFCEFREEAKGEHSGDCTNECHSCLRCHINIIYTKANKFIEWLTIKEK